MSYIPYFHLNEVLYSHENALTRSYTSQKTLKWSIKLPQILTALSYICRKGHIQQETNARISLA